MMVTLYRPIPLWRRCVASLTAMVLLLEATIPSVYAMDRGAESEDPQPLVIGRQIDLDNDDHKAPEFKHLIHEAILQGRQDEDAAIALVSEHIAQGLSLNEWDDHQHTPLDLAMQQDLRQLFIFLVSQGAVRAKEKIALEFHSRLNSGDPHNTPVYQAFKNLERANSSLEWKRTIDVLLPHKGNGKIVQTAAFKKRFLSPDLYNQLFDAKGTYKRTNRYGRRCVGKIAKNGYELYVKRYPEFPGLDQGVSKLAHRLVDRGVAYSELIRIDDVPYLISQGIPGPTLQDVLSAYPAWLDKLDPQSTSEMIVLAMLTNPEDGKPDNYVMESLKSGAYRLVAIDNERAFGPTGQVKSALYCLDQMLSPVHPTVRETFRSLNIDQILRSWVRELSSINTCYAELFTLQEAQALMTGQESFIGVPFTKTMLRQLYEKLVRLQAILEEADQSLTHLELLKKMEPSLGYRYAKALDHYKEPGLVFERFMYADGQVYAQGRRAVPQQGDPLTNTTFKAFLTALAIPLSGDSLDSIRYSRQLSPDAALVELAQLINNKRNPLVEIKPKDFETLTHRQRAHCLKQLDFKNLSLIKQQAWLEALMAQEDHRTLILKGCEALTDQHFSLGKPQSLFGWLLGAAPKPDIASSLRVSNIRELDLTGCKNITETLIPYLATQAVGLENLRLRDLSKVVRIQDPLLFPMLQWLDVGDCTQLIMVHLDAPRLRILKADGCFQLFSLKLATPLLKELDVRGAKSLTDEVLDQHLGGWPNLNILKLEGCDQIHHQRIRREFPQYPAGLLEGVSRKVILSVISLLRGTITKLDLYNNLIRADGGVAIAKALETNKSLTALDLDNNLIGVAGGVAIGKSLETNKSLTTLNLYNNLIGDAGAGALAKALETNNSLTEVYLIGNQIEDTGAEALAKALEKNTSLVEMSLMGNQISKNVEAKAQESIDKILKRNKNRPFTFVFNGDHLRLTKHLIDPVNAFEILTGLDLDKSLDRLLVRCYDQHFPLMASIFQRCFLTRNLPPSLCEGTEDLYQDWRQSQGMQKTATANALYQHWKQSQGMSEAEIVNNNAQVNVRELEANLEIVQQIDAYYAQKAVFEEFLSYYLKQDDWFTPRPETLGLLDIIAQTMKVNLCVWSSQTPGDLTLVYSLGPAVNARTTTHLLREVTGPFKHLVPIVFPGRDGEEGRFYNKAGPALSSEEQKYDQASETQGDL